MEVKHEESMTVKKGLVIKTDPAAGTTGNHASKVVIYVSSGVGKTKMPDLLGKTKTEAEKLLKAAGLEGEVVEEVKADLTDDEENTVTRQSIEKDTEIAKGTKVKYTVLVRALVEIPKDLIGQDRETVVQKLTEELGFAVEFKKTASTKPQFTVVSIEYEGANVAGQKVEKGATLIVTYSTGLDGVDATE